MASTQAAIAPELQRYVFQSREVSIPVVVRDASSSAATYLVSSTAARRLLPDERLDVVELLPGRALFSLACIDYRDNDLGDYNEVSLAFFARQRAAAPGIPYVGTALDMMRNRIATFIYKLPVNQTFTCEAGRAIWGFPKSVEQIDVAYADDRVTCRLVMGGQHVFTLTVPRGKAVGGDAPDGHGPDMEMATYTYLDEPSVVRFTTGGPTAVQPGAAGVELTLGTHPLADELRRLGLPAPAMMSAWMEHMHGRFEAPVRVA